MLKIFYILFLSHLIADFYFQSNSFCVTKEEKGFGSWQLYVHALVVMACAWAAIGHVAFWWGALILGVSHLLMDGVKHYVRKNKCAFFVDQLFHIAMMVLVAYLYQDYADSLLSFWRWNMKYVIYAVGFLLICKPTNVLIQNIFGFFELQVPDSNNKNTATLALAGHIIGTAERILAFLFVLVDQYEALGFLIAAKSILRFGDKETARTEYVLIGTLLSFLIAVLTAWGVERLV